jgi:murein DD-endopeptidase MepM/ murein hydrolase activator NlpD
LPLNDETDSFQISYKYQEIYFIESGQTFSNFLDQFDLKINEKAKVINLVSEEIDLKKIRIGTKIEINSSKVNEVKNIDYIIIYPNKERSIYLDFQSEEIKLQVDNLKIFKSSRFVEVEVNNSIYQSMIEKNIPENIIMEFIKLFSFDIDFQRDIRKENMLTLYFDYYKDEKQNYVKSDVINFAKIKLHNQSYELYRFTNDKGELIDYFDSNGKSATKALMKTPINGARLSSAYGMRKHPILGYNRLHQGVDFAAPTGTPIMAAGTGRIEKIGTNGGAGKYIRIKHLNGYKTAYAHLNSYASGMSKGVKVYQGQTIGFVGSTGLSTGPHLHYEVWFNNKKINPMTMRLPSGVKLNDSQLERFNRFKEKIDLEINNKINL